MVNAKIYDPDVFQKFESKYPDLINTTVVSRHAFGGLWAYYKSSLGSLEGIEYWEKMLENNIKFLHAVEIVQLTQAFNCNLQLN
mgnify:CR=1 FL=1